MFDCLARLFNIQKAVGELGNTLVYFTVETHSSFSVTRALYMRKAGKRHWPRSFVFWMHPLFHMIRTNPNICIPLRASEGSDSSGLGMLQECQCYPLQSFI